MKLFILTLMVISVQASHDIQASGRRTVALGSYTIPRTKLVTRGDSNKRLAIDSVAGPSQSRSVRPRPDRSQSGARSGSQPASTKRYPSPQSSGHSQDEQAGQARNRDSLARERLIRGGSRSPSLGRSHAQPLTQDQSPGRNRLRDHSQEGDRIARPNIARTPVPGRTSSREAPSRGEVASPNRAARPDRARSQSQVLEQSQNSNPSSSITQSSSLEGNRFPNPGSGIRAPDRSRPVLIHTAIVGPATVVTHLGQNPTEEHHIDVAAGDSLNRLWSNPYQAEVHIHTFEEGGQGLHRAWAAGGRRASIRTDTPRRTLTLGRHLGIAGPNSSSRTIFDNPPEADRGFIRASTRSYENHVGVDSMYQGVGLTILRASNSRAGSLSRPSSLSDWESDYESASDAHVE